MQAIKFAFHVQNSKQNGARFKHFDESLSTDRVFLTLGTITRAVGMPGRFGLRAKLEDSKNSKRFHCWMLDASGSCQVACIVGIVTDHTHANLIS